METIPVGELVMIHSLENRMFLGIITASWFDSVVKQQRYNIWWCNNSWGEDGGIYHVTVAPYREIYLKWRQKNLEPAI